MTKRASKEPAVEPNSPLAAVVEALRSQARALRSTDNGEAGDFIAGKVEGLESAIVLLQRAAAGEHVGGAAARPLSDEEVTGLVAMHGPNGDIASILDRLARLERIVSTAAKGPLHLLPEILREAVDAKPPAAARLPVSRLVAPPASAPPMGACASEILGVLARRPLVFIPTLELAILSGYSITSSTLGNTLRHLRNEELVTGERGGQWRITAKGLGIAGPATPMPTGRDLLEMWAAALTTPEAAILRAAWQDSVPTLGVLADITGYSASSSTFGNALRKLRRLRLIEAGLPIRCGALFQGGG